MYQRVFGSHATVVQHLAYIARTIEPLPRTLLEPFGGIDISRTRQWSHSVPDHESGWIHAV